MLGFIRFNQINYRLEGQQDCLPVSVDACSTDRVYKIPVKPGDTPKWIMEAATVLYQGAQIADLRIGLTNCGVLVVADIGTIEQGTSDSQIYCSAVIPDDIEDCDNMNLVIYSIYDPADCSQFTNVTGEYLCTNGFLGGELQCSGIDFGC
jgi:hypothetical protein